MIAYHGSNRNFKKLRISKSLTRYDSTLDNEGIGIYFSTDIMTADSYGKYVYVLNINDCFMLDMRQYDTCIVFMKGLVKYVYEQTHVNLVDLIDVKTVTNYVNWGGISVWNIQREILLMLDSNELYYSMGIYIKKLII